jgi:FkbM family methyltransferase
MSQPVFQELRKFIDGNGLCCVVKAPPGSGKSFNLLESLEDAIADGKRIANAAQTNNQVDAIDFNEFLKGFNKVDFLKMDIEGAETSVIPHIKEGLSKVDNLFIEFHSFDGQKQDFDKIIATLTDCGFRFYIDNVVFKNHPFINKKAKSNIDLQLNIFAYKI